jgi:hypothetical protein
MPRVWQKAPTAFPRHQDRQSSQQIARSLLPFSKRESIILIGRGGAARPAAGGAAGPVAAGGGVASPLADDGAEGAVAGDGAEGPVAGGRPVDETEVADDGAAGPVAAGGGVASPLADDGAEGLVAGVASAYNAAKDSQTGQTLPLQGRIAGTTRSRMAA